MPADPDPVYDFDFDFDTGESSPAAAPMPAMPASMPAIGALVRLRGCNFGQGGRVLRHERRRVVVYWPDLDFISRHVPASLVEVAP